MTDRVLVVGGGTRELVLAQKLSQSARVKQVLVAPGNTGAMGSEKITNSDVLISNPNILKQFCIDHNIRLVVVSQISLLAAGILDSLTAVGVRCFGPTAKAAQLEARRSFAKDFMDQHGIPMVQGKSFTNPHDACSFITYADFAALVVKPCSSASGRSLCIASDKDGACRAVQQLTHDTWTLGIPPETFLVEERLEGVEFSASAPLLRKIQDTILQQISCALKKEGMSYAGQNDMSLEGLQSCVASASAQQNRGAVADFAGAARTRETHPKDRQKPDFTATAISEVHLDAEQSGEAAFRQDSIKCGYLPLNAAQHKDPMLVCTTNSTDAKIQIARTCSQHSKVAEGLVATCMNDMLAQGAKTLFFMPYMACGKLDADITQSIATGLVSACKSSGSTLFEREIAYLPNVYPEGSYTLSGCAVGIVEREHKLPQLERMKAGDWIVGLRAAGVHSDNTALIEKILRKCSIDYSSLLPVGKGEQTWGDMLLNPPLTYSNILLAFIQSGHIRAFAPITEGGLMGSLQRVLPQSLGVIVDALCWRLPAIFSWLYKEGALSEQEMVSSFNCGLGAVLIAQKGFAQQIVLQLQKQEEAWLIGALIQHRGEHSPVRVTHMLEALRVNSFPLLKSLTVQRASGNTRKVAVFISSPGKLCQSHSQY
ncbi:trifunctional purine biosynthetic protein adenosine-3 [Xenopus tropicalis]|uniref:phosphoribosylformylglycinamidine cyclo-ligase n=1 Tax=Xenopus tropicalis TaxID=8364 RepID=A0A8J0SRT0_XENTR|nr:trifunctional purine biosynthetic protein adenosine-3 [Xenopus tropicalis]|eukprot:XP_017947277.1 PREDICTED: trifunctional purine biosynthetic protein adenosine-3-like [Xenopus tropicalis]